MASLYIIEKLTIVNVKDYGFNVFNIREISALPYLFPLGGARVGTRQ